MISCNELSSGDMLSCDRLAPDGVRLWGESMFDGVLFVLEASLACG